MKKLLFSLINLFLVVNLLGQSTIDGRIESYSNSKVFLASYYGDFKAIIDSAATDQRGQFKLSIPDDQEEGIYRLYFGEKKYLDLILGHNSFEFKTQYFDPFQKISFQNSRQNELLYQYLQEKKETQFKAQFILPILEYYPSNTPFYKDAQEEYANIHSNLKESSLLIISQLPDTYLSKYIQSDQEPAIDWSKDIQAINKAYKKHFLDPIDFNDTELLYTPLIGQKIIAFLDLYRPQQNDLELQTEQFKIAIDKLLYKSEKNPAIYSFIYTYLVKGFENNGFDQLTQYISLNHPLPKGSKEEMVSHIASIQKLSVGNFAPEIEQIDIAGKEFRLKKVKSDFTLLIFWEPNCPACDSYLPLIKKEVYDLYLPKNIEIIGIAISDNPEEVRETIKQNQYNWTNLIAAGDWNGKLVEEYAVSSTPKFFLLDKKKRILTQPQSLKEILIYLNE